MKKDDGRRESAANAASSAPAEGAALTVVSALMDERRRFEGWISSLEARRATTAPHVFARVHADYTTRLRSVLDQLTAHADGLRSELNALSQRLDALRDDQKRAEDERAEGELRAHVGEISTADWEKMAASSDARLTEIGLKHGAMEQDLVRTRELLESAERPVSAPSAVAAPVAVSPPAPEAAPAPNAAGEGERKTAPRPSAAVVPPPDAAPSEQQSLGIEEPHVAAPAPPPAGVPPAAAARPSKFDELAFLSSVVDTPTGAIEPSPADEPDEQTRRASFAMRAQEDDIVNPAANRSTPLDNLVTNFERDEAPVLSSRGSAGARGSTGADGAKTLKCSECASMNYPTEWYCERCGAELASL